MPRWLPIALVLLALLGVAAYGLLRPGAEPSRDPADVQRRLNGVPRQIGKWKCGDDTPLTDRTVNTGRFEAYLNRAYTHADGGTVAVMALYGETGDIGAHDPTVCYAGSGWELDGNPCKRRIGGPDGGEPGTSELWSAEFRKRGESLQVFWGWGVDGDWRADENPRFAFARHRRIYKVYFQRLVPGGTQSATADPLLEFVPKFLSGLNDAVPKPEH